MLLIAGMAATGCVNDPPGPATSTVTTGASPYVRGDLGTLTYRAVDLLVAAAPQLTFKTPIVVASISDTQDVEATSALGNIVSEMIRTRLAQDGYAPSEVRLRNEMNFAQGEGELMLSRERRALMPAGNAAAIVTGTYAASAEKVYVSIKLVSASDTRIIAGADFVVPLRDVSGLMHAHAL